MIPILIKNKKNQDYFPTTLPLKLIKLNEYEGKCCKNSLPIEKFSIYMMDKITH